jgi:two-component system, chemotaxis family, chemotaxis protein CheY
MKFCLLAEPSEVIRKIAKRILEDEHYMVVEADNGTTAYELIERAMPDVIFLDWQLQSVGAVELLEKIQPLVDPERRPRIIFCTTDFDPVLAARVKAAGANDILTKPFTRKMLLAKLSLHALAA